MLYVNIFVVVVSLSLSFAVCAIFLDICLFVHDWTSDVAQQNVNNKVDKQTER